MVLKISDARLKFGIPFEDVKFAFLYLKSLCRVSELLRGNVMPTPARLSSIPENAGKTVHQRFETLPFGESVQHRSLKAVIGDENLIGVFVYKILSRNS